MENEDAVDLLGEYLAEDPKALSQDTLKAAAAAFGVPLQDVIAIAKGMTNARNEVRKEQEKDPDV